MLIVYVYGVWQRLLWRGLARSCKELTAFGISHNCLTRCDSLPSYGRQTVQEKSVTQRKGQKTKRIQGVILPFTKPFYTSPFLPPLGFPRAKNPFMCMGSTVYSLFTLQLRENSIPWFVFVWACSGCSYCCRRVLTASFYVNTGNFHTYVED